MAYASYGSALGAAAAAAYNGNKEIVDLLLDRGVNINLKGGSYGSALGVAVYEERRDIVELLLDRGADININGGGYASPLEVARANLLEWRTRACEEMTALLLERGARLVEDEKDEAGDSEGDDES